MNQVRERATPQAFQGDVTGAGSPITDTDAPPSASLPKYRRVYDDLRLDIESGRYKPGDRLPSEAELGKIFATSRITVTKAVRELQTRGLVSRRAGSGTHVLPFARTAGHVFGLLIPDLGRTEIFEPICHGIMKSPLAKSHSLLWGAAAGEETRGEEHAEMLCQHYISKRVEGVFFAPLEFTPERDLVNTRIVRALERAGTQVVLLDRCYAPYPRRSRYDLVGIDNRRAGYMITQHLLQLGARRVAFISRPDSASTVQARIAGYREALIDHELPFHGMSLHGDPSNPDFLDHMLRACSPDAIVCANDLTAALLMTGLMEKGIGIPEEMRVVGFDDVKYASLLPVPLTTQHQDCADIGAMALSTMLRRLENPHLPTQDISLQTHTVVRRSCGAHLLARC